MKTNMTIALCGEPDVPTIFEIINESATAYRGVIPDDRWHEPYMPMDQLEAEIRRGVKFFGYRLEGQLVAVMGLEDVKDVTLIRHAYVRSRCRRHGLGKALLATLCTLTERPVLIGTWRAAAWAVRFYEKNDFTRVVDEAEKNALLDRYWAVPDRQKEVSVVLVDANWRNRLRAA